MRRASKVTLQHPLDSPSIAPAKKRNLLIDLHHVWNVIYNARSNKCQPPTSPNTAPATQS